MYTYSQNLGKMFNKPISAVKLLYYVYCFVSLFAFLFVPGPVAGFAVQLPTGACMKPGTTIWREGTRLVCSYYLFRS